MSTIDIPTDPAKLKILKAMIVEMTHAMQRADSEKEHIKDICKEASEQFGIPKTAINKLAKTMYKQDFQTIQQENEEFERLYETIQTVKA